jgi:hypothetical protein
MSSSEHTGAGEDDSAAGLGSSTEQHVTGSAETGTFITDEPPTGGTPTHGSSNAGINATGANRAEEADQAGTA